MYEKRGGEGCMRRGGGEGCMRRGGVEGCMRRGGGMYEKRGGDV